MSSRQRQDEMIRLLRRRGSVSVAELTDSLEVSRRTVLRDIAQLRDQGFVIQSAAGPGGGLYLDPTSILISPTLTSTEAFALLISFAVLRQTHTIPFTRIADSALLKIEQSLPRDRVLEMRKILKSVYIGTPNPDRPLPMVGEIENSVLPAFESCFLNSQLMQFGYTDSKRKITQRTAEPHAVLVLSHAWYLIGYDPNKQDFRHFRMDRINNAKVLEETFYRRKFIVDEGECPFSTSFL